MVRREPSIAPPAALQPSLPRHIPKLLQKKTKMAPIRRLKAALHSNMLRHIQTASYNRKTKMAPEVALHPFCRVTFPASCNRQNKDGVHKKHSIPFCRVTFPASYNRKNKDGAYKKHSIPTCRVIYPNCYKRKQRWRLKEALLLSLPRQLVTI
jgi:hypothetical protein